MGLYYKIVQELLQVFHLSIRYKSSTRGADTGEVCTAHTFAFQISLKKSTKPTKVF